VIPRSSHLTISFLQVFHVEWAVIGRNRSRLSNWVDVTHIVNRRRRVGVESLDVCVDILSSGEFFGHQRSFES
jgi:hypothetical protein